MTNINYEKDDFEICCLLEHSMNETELKKEVDNIIILLTKKNQLKDNKIIINLFYYHLHLYKNKKL